MEKIELKDVKKKKIEHKLLAQEVLKTMAYSFLTGLCMAAGDMLMLQ